MTAILLAIWPVLAMSLDPSTAWTRRVHFAVAVSAVLVALLIWLSDDGWQNVRFGLSEHTAAVAEMLWPLAVVFSVRRRLRQQARSRSELVDRDESP